MIFKTIAVLLVFFLGNPLAYAEIPILEDNPAWGAQVFIANQIKGIGLVDSYQEDNANASYMYDNCLAAMASMAMGNFGLAAEILDTICYEIKKDSRGLLFESYLFDDKEGNGRGGIYCGNLAWLLQTLNIYQRLKHSYRYRAMQRKIADFLVTLQGPDGALRGSTYDYWKSTEHNLIAYVALRNFSRLNWRSFYITRAERIRVFLKSPAIWNGVYFNRGPNDPTEVTDAQALGVLLLGSNYSRALTWAEQRLKISLPFNSQVITGFDFNNNLDTVWLEGTLQMALALRRSGNRSQGDYYFGEAMKTLQNDGALLLATNPGTASEYWMLQPWRAIAPTCWLIFYALNFNPLVLY